MITTGLLASAGCGLRDTPAGTPVDSVEQAAVEVAAAMGADGQALAAMGFDVADIDAASGAAATRELGTTETGAPDAVATGAPGERAEKLRERHRARVLLRRNTLHGEVVVRTEDGTRTVLVQRGTVTTIDNASMTVASTDGYTLTWRFGDNLRVVERRAALRPEEIAVGSEVGVAGARDGADAVARLVVVPPRK